MPIETTITLAAALAFLTESMTEYLCQPIQAAIKRHLSFDLPMRYAAAGVGVALAFAYGLDLLTAAGVPAQHPAVGVILTGLVIGRGSNYLHDFTALFQKAQTGGLAVRCSLPAGGRRGGR